jgi:hypothetical protein
MEDADVAEGRAIREARESGLIEKIERPLQPDYRYTLRRVDHRHPRRPTNFTRGENKSMINKDENPYVWTTELHDHRFWNNFQADLYQTVIKYRKNPITSQLYVDWIYMQNKRDPVFHGVISKAQRLGIYDILSMYQDWNMELVARFCATSWRSGHGYDSTLNFSIEGHRLELKLTELPTIFAFANNDFHRSKISTERTIAENELAPPYYPRNEHNFGSNHGLLPKYYIFKNIFRNTLTPK